MIPQLHTLEVVARAQGLSLDEFGARSGAEDAVSSDPNERGAA